jgi:hypothetical protein
MLIILDEHYDVIYNSAWFQTPETITEQAIVYRPNFLLKGDFTIKLYRLGHHNLVRKVKEVLRVSLQTAFLAQLGTPFPKDDSNGPAQDTGHLKHPDDFMSVMQFAIPQSPSDGPEPGVSRSQYGPEATRGAMGLT